MNYFSDLARRWAGPSRLGHSVCHKIVVASVVALLLTTTACTHSTSDSKARLHSQNNDQKSQAIVVTANPHATKAGADVLRAGGSAVDAAIAIQSVLSLVEPQSSGMAGGAFMMYYDQQAKELTAYDGRETAPQSISATQFLNLDGESIGYLNAKNSGLSTGAPGVVAMLDMAHQDHGALPWGRQFDHAIKLAEEGFDVSPRLFSMFVRFGKYIPKVEEEGPTQAYEYFFKDDGESLQIGDGLKNPEYAEALRAIAVDSRAMYEGDLADAIVAEVQKTPRAGSLSKSDLAAYKPLKLNALCQTFKGYSVCGPPPASSWVAVGQIMGILDHAPEFSESGENDPANWTLFSEAQRLAYADRDRYIADSAFVDVPLEGLLNEDYLKARAALIKPNSAVEAKPGPAWDYQGAQAKVAMGQDATQGFAGTSHFVVVDAKGNVVSMTSSVESIFGTTRMAGGMFLNNQLTDFSFKPKDDAGLDIANRIEPGKRPRSSMSPSIVFDQSGDFYMATGSPGGNSIIAYTAKTLVGVLAWGMDPQDAVNLPNIVSRGDRVRIEKDRASPQLIQGLKDFGYDVNESSGENSGLSVVVKSSDGTLKGAADPRREGVVEVVEFAHQVLR